MRSGAWSVELAERLALPWRILPPLRDAGSVVGPVLPAVGETIGEPGVPVIAVGSHDTASAVVGVPAGPSTGESRFAYISSGTWSLVGLELDRPVLDEAARLADFTNEGGVDGTIRFLKNVMGLWVLSESVRTWAAQGLTADLPTLLSGAAHAEPLRTVVDIDDASLLPPGDMPERLRALARAAGEPVPESPGEVVRTILDSLALAYRRNVRLAAELAGQEVEVVHVVGGGSQNALLCQLTADACGVPVLAGPAEAAALGNALVQARTLSRSRGGDDLPDLAAMRALVRRTHDVTRFDPRPGLDWATAEKRARR